MELKYVKENYSLEIRCKPMTTEELAFFQECRRRATVLNEKQERWVTELFDVNLPKSPDEV